MPRRRRALRRRDLPRRAQRLLGMVVLAAALAITLTLLDRSVATPHDEGARAPQPGQGPVVAAGSDTAGPNRCRPPAPRPDCPEIDVTTSDECQLYVRDPAADGLGSILARVAPAPAGCGPPVFVPGRT